MHMRTKFHPLDWQYQQVNRTAHPLFPVALGKRQVKEASGGQRYILGVGSIEK